MRSLARISLVAVLAVGTVGRGACQEPEAALPAGVKAVWEVGGSEGKKAADGAEKVMPAEPTR